MLLCAFNMQIKHALFGDWQITLLDNAAAGLDFGETQLAEDMFFCVSLWGCCSKAKTAGHIFFKMQPQALEEVNLLYNLKNPIVLLLIDRGEKRLQTGFQFSSLQRSLTARSGMRDDGG